MRSRMDRYSKSDTTTYRTDRNRDLYKEVENIDLDVPRTYSNSKVIDEVNKEIDIEKIKRYIEKMNTPTETPRPKINDIKIEAPLEEEVEEEKDYDLNSVIEKARRQREVDYEQERSRKVNYSYEEILDKIQKYNNKQQEQPQDEDELNTNEKTLVNLINTIQMNKKEIDLFDDLKGNDDTQLLGTIDQMASDETFKEEVREQISNTTGFSMSFKDGFMGPSLEVSDPSIEITIEEKINEEELDDEEETNSIETTNSFYTTNDVFDKSDFNNKLTDDEEDEDDEKTSPLLIIGIIIAVIVLVAILVVIANYVFESALF